MKLRTFGLLCAFVCLLGCGDEEATVVPKAPRPAEPLSPPVSGGTLLVRREAKQAVVADPTVDKIFVVDLGENALVRTIDLESGAEPGRLVAGAADEVFVVLRDAGAVARVNTDNGAVARVDVCPVPRGVDYDAQRDQLFVACAGGELVILNGALERVGMMMLDRDLRDVVLLDDGRIALSRFRAAELLIVDPRSEEAPLRGRTLPFVSPILGRNFAPGVAYRMQKLPNGQLAMLHQRSLADIVPIVPPMVPGHPGSSGSAYGGGSVETPSFLPCDAVIVHAAVTMFDPARTTGDIPVIGASDVGMTVVPVDLAVSPDGEDIAMVGAGNNLLAVNPAGFVPAANPSCMFSPNGRFMFVHREPVAVAYDDPHDAHIVVQTVRPSGLDIVSREELKIVARIDLPAPTVRNAGWTVFHRQASDTSPIACASCHPEGHEDGRVWAFEGEGSRRTQDVSGGISATAPFHWNGDFASLHDLMGEVFTNRMGGPDLLPSSLASLETWLDSIERLPASSPLDPAAAARGKEIFRRKETACAICHAGAAFTNNSTIDIRTGRAFQVPSLVGLWSRAPYMHDGCAATLEDRFTLPQSCSGGEWHGNTSRLLPNEIADLIAYLDSL